MRASWFALNASLTRVLNRTSFETEFKVMGLGHPELASFATIASLMEHQHGPMADAMSRFRVIRSLVAAAQTDESYRPTAQIIVMLALWPGLDAVFCRLARGFPAARDDLAAEILSRVTEAVLVLDLDKVTAVTATLLRNVERDIRRDLIEARTIGEASSQIDDDAVEALATAMAAPVSIADRDLADYLFGLGLTETDLLKRIFVLGETQEEAGQALGLSPAAARKRFQRSLQKLKIRQIASPAVSHLTAPIGL